MTSKQIEPKMTRQKRAVAAEDSLTIIQWNARSIRNKMGEFSNFVVREGHPDIIMIQETFLSAEDNFDIPGYHITRVDKKGKKKGRGVATLIKDNIQARQEVVSIDPPCLKTTIRAKTGEINCVNLYLPIGEKTQTTLLRNIFATKSVLVGGDFNAHLPQLNPKRPDRRGRQIQELTEEHSLVLLSDGSGTRLNQHTGTSSAIDLTMASPKIATRATWEVMEENMGSDHHVIKITLSGRAIAKTRQEPRLNMKKADWRVFREETTRRIGYGLPYEDMDKNNEYLTHAIMEAARASMPTRGLNNRILVPYWNSKCDDAIRARNKAQQQMKNNNTEDNRSQYKESKRLAQWTTRKEQRVYWEKYCDALNSDSTTKEVWDAVGAIRGTRKPRALPSVAMPDGRIPSEKESAELFADFFASTNSDSNYNPEFLNKKRAHQNRVIAPHLMNHPLAQPITVAEIQATLRKAGNSAPGDDQVTYELLRQLPGPALQTLCHLLNQSWLSGKIPKEWKTAKVIPIHKPGKPTDQTASYRPISLTATICKLLEKILAQRLDWFLESEQLYNPCQAGFRKNRGCADQVARLAHDAAMAIGNLSTTAVFLDVEKAYDMVWREGIINRMMDLGIPSRLVTWTRDFLTDRYIQVRLGSATSSRREVQNGTPQGSAISPILFNILMSATPDSPAVRTSIFADDIAVWRLDHNPTAAARAIQAHLDDIDQHFGSIGLKVSSTKSQCMIIARSKKQKQSNLTLTISGQPIPRAASIKFLGMTFDEGANWREHATNLAKKCEERMAILRAVSGLRWGANKSTLLTLYRALIRSKLDYGCEGIDFAPKTTKTILNRIQNKALSLCCGAMRGTPVAAIQVECGEPPLDLRRRRIITNLAARIFLTQNNPTKDTYFPPDTQPQWRAEREAHLRTRMERKNPTGYGPFQSTLDYLTNDSAYPLGPPREAPWRTISSTQQRIHDPMQPATAPLICYTDASSRGNRTGVGVYIPQRQEGVALRITDNISMATAETLAVYVCLRVIREDPEWREAIILTDSKDSTDAISGSGPRRHAPLVASIREEIQEIQNEGRSLTIYRIPAHAGIQGNEEADKLAKEGAANGSVDIQVPTSINDIKARSLKVLKEQWQDRWDRDPTGREFKRHREKVEIKGKKSTDHRRKEVMMTRLRMGHTRLNAGLHRLQLHETGECDHCPGQKEDTQHVIMDCPARAELHNKMRTLMPRGATLEEILNNQECQNTIFEYLRVHQDGGI